MNESKSHAVEPVTFGSISHTTFRSERWVLDGEQPNKYPGRLCHACGQPNDGDHVYVSKQQSDASEKALWTCKACMERLYGKFGSLAEALWGDEVPF